MSMYSLQKVKKSSTNLPHDQSFRKYQLPTHLLILSVAENGVAIGKDSVYGTNWSTSPDGFHIFAEHTNLFDLFKVKISSSLSMVTLSTRTMRVSTSSECKSSTVEVSGAAGEDNNTGGQPLPSSINGKPGGKLTVYVESCDAKSANGLSLLARGGDGGNTRQAAGKAGNGGDGGQVQFLTYSSKMEIYQKLCQIASNKTYNDERTVHTKLTADSPLTSDLRSVLALSKVLGDWPMIASIMKPIELILERLSSQTLPTQNQALNVALHVSRRLETQVLDEESNMKMHASADGGCGGSPEPPIDGGSRGTHGSRGKPGNSEYIHNLLQPDPDLMRKHTAVFVHPEQCQMLFDRAMTYWYFGYLDPAVGLLKRLLLRFAFLPLQKTDPLYLAYESQQSALRCPNSIAKLELLQKMSMTKLSALIAGQTDYYGYKPNWAPRVSYTELQNYILPALQVFRQLETSYMTYHRALESQQDVKETVNATKANIDNSLADLDEEIQSLVQTCKELDVKISLSGQKVEDLHFDFQRAYDAFKDQIEKSHYIETKEVINAVCDFITAPSKIGAATTMVKMGYDWYNLAETNNTGAPVTKKFLLESLKRSTVTSRKDFIIDFSKDRLSGEFNVDGRADKFVLEKEKLEQLLADFTTTQFAKLGDELVEKFQKFIDDLRARNEDVVLYNNTLQAILDRLGKKKELQRMKETAEKKVIIDDDLEQMTNYMRIIYDNARARVMRYITLGQKALTFKILKKEDLFKRSGLDINGDIPLSITADVLTVVHSNLNDLLLQATEENSNAPADFTRKRRLLTPKELEVFLEEKIIQLPIPPVFPKCPTNDQNREFDDSANIRVYRVQFVLNGLRRTANAKRAIFQTTIEHAGPETIVSRRGIANKFEHYSLSTRYSYAVGAGGSREIRDDGKLVSKPSQGDKDSTFGAPGPFTTWTVDAKRSDWKFLDISSVTGAYLEFEGANYAFFH